MDAPWCEPLLTAAEMRAAEARHPGPTLELMERAGAACAAAALDRFPDARRWSIRCGGGANGGDGLVVARLLHEAGRDVHVVLHADEARVVGDAAANLRRVRDLGLPVGAEPGEGDAIVDALFGTGFAGAPRLGAAAAIAAIAQAGVPVVAVDLPSGVDASTGEVAGAAVRADLTVTFHRRKLGHAVAPGRFLAGEVVVADIGLDAAAGEAASGAVGEAIVGLVPRRGPQDNKYSAGSVLVVGGSTGLTGAPCLSSLAALRAGAGIVVCAVPASLDGIFEQRLLEVMSRPCPDDAEGRLVPAAADAIVAAAARAGAVALGPGIGRGDGVRALVGDLLARLDLPLVLDADGLFAAVGQLDAIRARRAPTVLTPHAGELARLLGRESAWIAAHRLAAVREAVAATGAVVLLKGADTLVAAPGDDGVLVSDLGNPGLATAGSGDVLTGVVAALLAKGMEPRLAAAAAAATGGVAARLAAARHGEAGLIASDVVDELSRTVSAHGKGGTR
ncbi:MAG: NAD(P)H-hydrate dehydratase [Thermoleophilia bacterium]